MFEGIDSDARPLYLSILRFTMEKPTSRQGVCYSAPHPSHVKFCCLIIPAFSWFYDKIRKSKLIISVGTLVAKSKIQVPTTRSRGFDSL